MEKMKASAKVVGKSSFTDPDYFLQGSGSASGSGTYLEGDPMIQAKLWPWQWSEFDNVKDPKIKSSRNPALKKSGSEQNRVRPSRKIGWSSIKTGSDPQEKPDPILRKNRTPPQVNRIRSSIKTGYDPQEEKKPDPILPDADSTTKTV